MVRFKYIIAFILALDIFIFPQSEEIEEKAKSLLQLREEIRKLEQELELNQIKEKNSYAKYQNLNKQKFYFQKIVISLQKEENIKTQKIDQIKSEIKNLQSQIEQIKEDYSKYIVYNYKYGRISEIEAIIISKNLRQAILRFKYLRDFSNRQKKNINFLNEKIAELNLLQTNLAKEIEDKRLLAAEKNKDLNSLNNLINAEQYSLSELRKDKSIISKQISDKRKSEVAIKNLIDKLIADSEKPKIVLNKKTEKADTEKEIIKDKIFENDSLNTATSFNELKGRLSFPVSRGKVVSDFGAKQNVRLKTISINNGIDILCTDPIVRTVTDGVVSAIEWLPGFGTVVIITHKGNYRTVYGHLENIQVSENQRISGGSVIGSVSNGIEGRILHFQIWNGRQSIDPLAWLKK